MQKTITNCFWALAITVFLLMLMLPQSALAEKKKVPEDAMATVNGAIIKRENFYRTVAQVEKRFARMGRMLSESQRLEIKKDILEELINRELLFQESQKKGIKIEDAKVREQLKRMKSQYATDAEFKRALDNMGFLETNIEVQFKEWMAIRQFVNDHIAKNIKVPEQDIRASYDSHPQYFKQPEKVHAAHILIKVDPAASEAQKTEARKEIEKIKKKLKEGEDFTKLAKTYSQGPSSAKGGDLGYFGRGQMVKPFETAAFALKPGEISDIVKTRFGYHLIKVFDKKPPITIPYEEAKEKIAHYLMNERVQKQLNQFVSELKKNAKIQRAVIKNP